MAEGDIEKVQKLLDGVKAWKGLGGLTTTDLPLDNIQLYVQSSLHRNRSSSKRERDEAYLPSPSPHPRWLHQAKTDPSITAQQIQDWGHLLETHLRASVTRFDYAKLFGNLLTEWLQSGDSQATGSMVSEDSDDAGGSESMSADKPARAEKLEQKDKIQELIFTEKPMDTEAIETYLKELFSTPDATATLNGVRKQLEELGNTLRRATVSPHDLKSWLISSLLNRGSSRTTCLVRLPFLTSYRRHPFRGENGDTQRIYGQRCYSSGGCQRPEHAIGEYRIIRMAA